MKKTWEEIAKMIVMGEDQSKVIEALIENQDALQRVIDYFISVGDYGRALTAMTWKTDFVT